MEEDDIKKVKLLIMNKHGKKIINDRDMEIIICSMYCSFGSIQKIAGIFSVSYHIIRNTLIKYDIKRRTNSEAHRKFDTETEIIIISMYKSGGSSYEIADYFLIGPGTTLNILNRYSVKRRTLSETRKDKYYGQNNPNYGKYKITDEKQVIICSMYLSGSSSGQIADYFVSNDSTIRNVLIRNNIPRRKFSEIRKGRNNPMFGKHKFSKKTQLIICNKYKNGLSLSLLAKKYLCSCDTIKNILIRHNIKTRNISEANHGEKNGRWQGGTSFEPYGLEFNKKLKEKIRKLYNYRCQRCLKHQSYFDKKLSVHHIDYNKKNNRRDNLIPLCREHHSQTNSNREYWTIWYKMLVRSV